MTEAEPSIRVAVDPTNPASSSRAAACWNSPTDCGPVPRGGSRPTDGSFVSRVRDIC